MPTVRAIIQKASELSSLPTVYVRVNDAVNDPSSSIADVAAIIAEDPGLTSRLLKLVNSTFFGFPQKITSVQRACATVGLQQLRALALSTSVMSLFKSVPADLVDLASFWRHSVACGIAASALGRRCGFPGATETLFTAGILHDVGRLVLITECPDLARAAFERADQRQELLFIAEKAVCGFDHCDVNAELFRFWQFPVVLQEAGFCHHRPANACRFPTEAALVHLADIIVHAGQFGRNGEQFVPRLDTAVLDRTGLQPDGLESLLTEVEEHFADVVNILAPGDDEPA